MKKFRNLILKESQELNVNELDSIVAGNGGTATWWVCTCSKVEDICTSASVSWGSAGDIKFKELIESSAEFASRFASLGSNVTLKLALDTAGAISSFMDICSSVGISGYKTNHKCIEYPYQNVHLAHEVYSGSV